MVALNQLSPGEGARTAARRVGRGIGSGLGKTCGRGHKGQKARSGGYHKRRVGFEGGQMPLQRRLPKFGFTSRKSLTRAEIPSAALAAVDADLITLDSLKNSGIITKNIKQVKIMLSGVLQKAVTVQGLPVSKGAKAAIEQAGGKVIEA